MAESFEFDENAENSPAEAEFQAKDNEFVGVRIADFYSPKAAIFDHFLRLGKERYIKILSTGESYDEEALRNYESERGLKQVFFRKENRQRYISFLWTILQRIIPLAAVKISVKFSVAKSLSELWMQELALSDEKNRPTMIEDGKDICSTIAGWIEIEPKLEAFLIELPEVEPSIEAIAFLTGFFAGVTSRRFPWKSRKTTETLLLASYLCDIGFSALPPELARMRVKRMNETQRKDYQRHPELSSGMLSCCKTLSENILTIVREHHEYVDGSGFPQKLKGNRTLFLSKFICLCGDLVRASSELLLPPKEAVKVLFPVRSQKLFTENPEIAAKYDSDLMLQFFAIFPMESAEGASR